MAATGWRRSVPFPLWPLSQECWGAINFPIAIADLSSRRLAEDHRRKHEDVVSSSFQQFEFMPALRRSPPETSAGPTLVPPAPAEAAGPRVAVLHQQTVLANLDLLNVHDAPQGRQHGDFIFELAATPKLTGWNRGSRRAASVAVSRTVM
jgi:hypothetical protein